MWLREEENRHLRRGVFKRPDYCKHSPLWLVGPVNLLGDVWEVPRVPEVCQYDACTSRQRGHQDIVRLEISVYDVAVVEVLDGLEYLSDHHGGFCSLQASASVLEI